MVKKQKVRRRHDCQAKTREKDDREREREKEMRKGLPQH